MKVINQSLAAALLSLALAGAASASLSTGNLFNDVQSAVGSHGQISVQINNGVATLTGWGNYSASAAAERAAAAHPDVDSVINLVTRS